MGDDGPSITIFIPQYTIFCKRVHIYIYIHIYIPSGPQVLRWPHIGCCPAADDHVVSCSATGRGGVGLGVLSFVECWSRFWCSAADDHVVSCSATGRGGAGWGVLSFVECWSRCWCSVFNLFGCRWCAGGPRGISMYTYVHIYIYC